MNAGLCYLVQSGFRIPGFFKKADAEKWECCESSTEADVNESTVLARDSPQADGKKDMGLILCGRLKELKIYQWKV